MNPNREGAMAPIGEADSSSWPGRLFEQLESSPKELQALRRRGWDAFAKNGFPTTALEDWKYTSIASIASTSFALASAGKIDETSLPAPKGGSLARLSFVNGVFSKSRSDLSRLPKGVLVENLAAAWSNPIVTAHLGTVGAWEQDAFAALNTAFLQDGAIVYIPRSVTIDEVIHLEFLSTPSSQALFFAPRVLVVLESNTSAAVMETHVFPRQKSGVIFSNAVTEIVLGENAQLHHVRSQVGGEMSYDLARLYVRQRKASTYRNCGLDQGAKLVRKDAFVELAGEAAEAVLDGLFVAGPSQHIDNHTTIDHAVPHCTSHELYKGILGESGRGVFNGKIIVRPHAQKTQAFQSNRNLLLSRTAVVDTKPELQIHANDVKCTHGATIGQMEDDALFYLRARGIGELDAKAMLMQAFAAEVGERVQHAGLQDWLTEEISSRLSTLVGVRSL